MHCLQFVIETCINGLAQSDFLLMFPLGKKISLLTFEFYVL